MTLGKLIETIIALRGQQYDTDIMVGWVNEIESQAVEQVINRSEGVQVDFTPYEWEIDMEKELLIPDRFQDVYMSYMFAKIDFMNQEIERYNNDVAMQDAAWKAYASWHIRTHMPKAMPSFQNF